MPELIYSALMATFTNDKDLAHSCCLSKGQARAGTGHHETQFISFLGLLFLLCTIGVWCPLLALKHGSVGVEPPVGVASAAELPDNLISPHRQTRAWALGLA